MSIWRQLWNDETGAILTAETVLLGSVGVVGVVTGLTQVRDSVVSELTDLAEAIGSMDQSYYYGGVYGHGAYTAGSGYRDRADVADAQKFLVCATPIVCSQAFPNARPVVPYYGPPGPPPGVMGPPPAYCPPAPPVGVAPRPVMPPPPPKVEKPKKPVPPPPAPEPKKKKKPRPEPKVVTPPPPTAVVPPPPAPVHPAPPVPCVPGPSKAVVVGAPGLAPCLSSAWWGGPEVRVFMDPRRGGAPFIDAPEGYFNECVYHGVWPMFHLYVAHPGGFCDAGYYQGCAQPAVAPPAAVGPGAPARKPGELITLRFVTVGNDDLKHVGDFEDATALHVVGSEVTDEGLKVLGELKNLVELHLIGTKVTDRGLEHLRRIKGLEALHLVGAQITDAGLKHIAAMEQLKVVDLRGTQVTAEGVERLGKERPNLRVIR